MGARSENLPPCLGPLELLLAEAGGVDPAAGDADAMDVVHGVSPCPSTV